jgi:hypothetical protein
MLTEAKEKSTYNTTGPEGHGMMRQTPSGAHVSACLQRFPGRAKGRKFGR